MYDSNVFLLKFKLNQSGKIKVLIQAKQKKVKKKKSIRMPNFHDPIFSYASLKISV